MSPPNAMPISGAAAMPAAAPSKPPVDADIRVCLDFIKGRCTRTRCRFYHPEMTGYQQVSNAVQASAGRQICEVWAMAGTCKFGSKCNKLHPVVLSQPVQPVHSMMAISIPSNPLANMAALAAATTAYTPAMWYPGPSASFPISTSLTQYLVPSTAPSRPATPPAPPALAP
eukprot:EG_transcript_35883